MIYLIGTHSCDEACGSSVVIYGVATNDIDALRILDELKNRINVGYNEHFDIWEREENTLFIKNWIG